MIRWRIVGKSKELQEARGHNSVTKQGWERGRRWQWVENSRTGQKQGEIQREKKNSDRGEKRIREGRKVFSAMSEGEHSSILQNRKPRGAVEKTSSREKRKM